MKQARTKNTPLVYIIVVIIALIGFGLKKCMQPGVPTTDRTVTTVEGDWRHHKLIYTKHARCRMDCRDISESEVEYVLANGVINEAKSREESDEAEGHCPTSALEGNTSDGQHVRIVFGACDKITKVITAIDLGVEHSCDCR